VRDRHSDLNEQLSRDTVTVPTPGYLAQVRDHVRTVLKDGTEAGRKAALHELIHEIQGASRAEIRPIFRVPAPEDGALTPDDPAVPGVPVRAPYRRVPTGAPTWTKNGQAVIQVRPVIADHGPDLHLYGCAARDLNPEPAD